MILLRRYLFEICSLVAREKNEEAEQREGGA